MKEGYASLIFHTVQMSILNSKIVPLYACDATRILLTINGLDIKVNYLQLDDHPKAMV